MMETCDLRVSVLHAGVSQLCVSHVARARSRPGALIGLTVACGAERGGAERWGG
jgi:hypothetical protein